MAAPESTKFQINYKLADGTLVNLYATNQAELEASLGSIADLSTLITTTGSALGATAQSSNGAVAYAKKTLGATAVSAPSGDAPDLAYQQAYIFRIPPAERDRNPNLTQNIPFR